MNDCNYLPITRRDMVKVGSSADLGVPNKKVKQKYSHIQWRDRIGFTPISQLSLMAPT